MAKREVLGLMVCPECGMEGAEVKAQKNGLAYRWCPECNAQYFTRTEEASERLLAKVGAGGTAESAQVTVTKEAAKADPVQEPPKKRGTGNPFLDLMQGV